MKSPTPLDRLRYTFDNFMSKGPVALIGGLALISLVFILVMGLLVYISGIAPEEGQPLGFWEAFWASLMRTLDAGTMGADSGWGFRLVMLVVTLGGIFIISTLIGLLTSGIEAKLDELRKGRSQIIESGHTLILGWNDQIFPLIEELILANQSQQQACIAVLATLDKVEMEDALRERFPSPKPTRIVCRTGDPQNMADLDRMSVQTSRSIVVLADAGSHSDTQVVQSLLAITQSPNRRQDPYHVVAQVQNSDNLQVIRLAGGEEVEPILTGDLISRIMVQTCRQSGLSIVYMDLLDFGGDEIYFKVEPGLVGKAYGHALHSFETASVMGIQKAEGQIILNPPMDTLIQKGDQMIVVAQDDDKIHLTSQPTQPIAKGIVKPTPRTPQAESTLILGWNDQVPAIIRELDQYVAPGSMVMVVAPLADGRSILNERCSGIKAQAVQFQAKDPTQRQVLDDLYVPQYNHVIVLCSDQLPVEQADAQTLVTLLQLRDIANRSGHRFPIVTEILDPRNQSLAQVAQPDDFVISEQIISRMMAQVSEQKNLNAVFTDLFDPEGVEIYLRPITDYVTTGSVLNYATLVSSARRQGQSALGYRIQSQMNDATAAYGVYLNPPKSTQVTFAPEDRVIVLAED